MGALLCQGGSIWLVFVENEWPWFINEFSCFSWCVCKHIPHAKKRRNTQYHLGFSVCTNVGVVYIFLALPTQVLCARQSPCQYCGLHHLSGLAWGHRQSLVWLRLDFVMDQWDLGGQTVCHCILPCTQPKFCLFLLTLYCYLLDS